MRFYGANFRAICYYYFFFFDAPAPSGIYTLSLHDALPIFAICSRFARHRTWLASSTPISDAARSRLEIGRAPSELQSHHDLVCRLLLEKKKKKKKKKYTNKK